MIKPTKVPKEPKRRTAREKAELIVMMSKELQRVERQLGAEACIMIGIFRDGNQLIFQDAGRFPLGLPPTEFYKIMIKAHEKGQFLSDEPVSKIIKPN